MTPHRFAWAPVHEEAPASWLPVRPVPRLRRGAGRADRRLVSVPSRMGHDWELRWRVMDLARSVTWRCRRCRGYATTRGHASEAPGPDAPALARDDARYAGCDEVLAAEVISS